ncbi:transglutaminaseTgpA domain-containing protein [Acinetobacter pseudolwoffii]|uniref:transglutaminase family protein n=1 Tax=Acinetobacter pseudolwoffii TaxID=2053287 RepID=UPI0035263316
MINAKIRTSIVLTLSLILIAQMAFIPVLLSIIFAISILCIWIYLKRQQPFPKIGTFLLTVLALGSIYLSYQSFIGVEAGVAVLSTFLFAKSLESKNRRDLIILFNFALFVAASSFLYSQSFGMAIVIVLCLISCLIGLYRIQTSEFEQEQTTQRAALQQDAKHVAKFILYAIPFFLLLFIFFPRLPPLWHIPIPENKGVTGISDSMSPGDIAELSQSSALAFRIIGDVSKLPPRSELYWRALVLDEYDGQRWTSSFVNQQPLMRQPMDSSPVPVGWNYQYLAADPSVFWIMGLEKSIPVERRYYNRQDWSIVPRRLTQRVEPIPLQWIGTQYDPQAVGQYLARINTQVQRRLDPQAQQLAQRLYMQSAEDPRRYVQNVLNWYQQNNFVYTLKPGQLGQNRIDEFLFNSRQGFCEHYASSFVMLMRYVGIPARVVTGYQGGELAPDRKSWEVRQLDAHAWTEVWLDQKWQRFDPTAMIAPQRIDGGMQNLMSQDERVWSNNSTWTSQNNQWMTKMRVWSDYASYQWQSKVVGYNAESQQNWLSKLGLSSAYSSIIVLLGSIALLILAYGLRIYLKARQAQSPFDRAIQQLNQSLADDLKKQPAETFHHWMQRLSQQVKVENQSAFIEAIRIFEKYLYSGAELTDQELKKFKDLLKTCADSLKIK